MSNNSLLLGITGFNGFIGNAVGEAMARQGHSILSLDPWVREQTLNKNPVSGHLDWIFHFGAKTSIAQSHKDPTGTYKSNLESTLRALEIARQQQAKFLYLSSYIYGKPHYLPVDEDHEIQVTNPYMGSKYLCEQLCRQVCKFFGVPLCILRPFNIYGLAFKEGRLFSDLLLAFNERKPLVLNDPDPRRDYLYIKDFITLLEKIVYTDEMIEGIFNVGSGQSHSNREIVNIFNSLTERPVEVITNTQPRPNDILECVADASKAIEAFTWKPHYTLEQGISEVIMEMETLNVEDL